MKKIFLLFISVFAIGAAVKAQSCADTVYTYFDRSSANYTYTLDTGFIFGPNLYTKEVGNNYDVSSAQLKGVLIVFNQKDIIGTADSFSVYVYNTKTTDSLPTGAAIASKKISTNDVDTTQAGFFTYVEFPSLVNVSRNYAITVQVYGAGIDDSVAIGANAQGDGLGERRSILKAGSNAWYHMGEFWTTGSAPLDVDALMVPVLERSFSALASTDVTSSCPGSTVNLSSSTFSCNGSVSYSWAGPGIANPFDSLTTAIIPSTATDSVVYTLTAIDPTANDTVVSKVTILVKSISVNAGTDVQLNCGGTTDLSATVSGSTGVGTVIQWVGGPASLTWTQRGAGTYIINVSNATGCRAADTVKVTYNSTQNVNFSIRSLYNGTIDTATTTPCANVPVTFTNTSATTTGWTWAWSTASGGIGTGTDFANTFATPGVDTVTLVGDSAGCQLSRVKTISVLASTNANCRVGINDIDFASLVSVYPNPTSGMFNIAFTGVNSSNVSLSVFDVVGRTVYAQNNFTVQGNETKSIDLGKNANGIYFVKIQVDGQPYTVRLNVAK